MKRIIPVLAALLLLLALPLMAQEQDASAQTSDPAQNSDTVQDQTESQGTDAALPAEAYGLPVRGQKIEEDRTFLVLGEEGAEILLSADVEPDAERIQALSSLSSSLRSSSGITVEEIRAINSADRLVILVLPSKLMAGTTDCAASLPGGLQFIYSSNYEYDFRVLAGGRYIRMKGIYTAFSALQQNIADVLADPLAYTVKQDPLAAAREVAELETRVDRLEAALITSMNGGRALPESAVSRLREYRKAEPGISKAAAGAKLSAEGIQLSQRELDIAFSVLFGE